MVHFKAAITFPNTKRWEHTNPPNLGSLASICATFDILTVDYKVGELTYLHAALLASTPRKVAVLWTLLGHFIVCLSDTIPEYHAISATTSAAPSANLGF